MGYIYVDFYQFFYYDLLYVKIRYVNDYSRARLLLARDDDRFK